jgi:hypothetical protein
MSGYQLLLFDALPAMPFWKVDIPFSPEPVEDSHAREYFSNLPLHGLPKHTIISRLVKSTIVA